MTSALLVVLATGLGSCVLLTPGIRALACRWGLLDRPDGRRKVHGRPIPVAGGVAILLSGNAAVAVAFLVPGPLAGHLADREAGLVGLLLAALVICLVGVADDYGCLRVRYKLAGQLVAVAVVVGSGLVVRGVHLFGLEVALGPAAVPFTVLWLLATINSHNLLDGMDGLLSTVGLVLCLALAGMAALTGQWATAAVACALAGALLGFLRYNFPPASIFLGDGGSMLIGLVVGVLAIRGTRTGPDTVPLAALVALFTVPFLDTTAAILRRKLTGRSVCVGDRGHLHHRLRDRGLSGRCIPLCVGAFCLLAAAGALASLWWRNDLFAAVTAAAVVLILVASRLFGHAEMVLLRNSLLKLLGSLVPGGRNGASQEIEVRLQGSAAWQDVWNELVACARRLNLLTVRFNVNAPALHEGYHASWACSCGEVEEVNRWRADIPLAVAGQTVARLEISGRRDDQPVSARIADVARLTEQFEEAVCRLAEAIAANRAVVRVGVQREPHPVLGPPHAPRHFPGFSTGAEGAEIPGVGTPGVLGVGTPGVPGVSTPGY